MRSPYDRRSGMSQPVSEKEQRQRIRGHLRILQHYDQITRT